MWGRRMRVRTLNSGKHRPYTYRYYVCMRNDNLHVEQKCKAPQFNADEIDEVVWQWVKSILAAPQEIEDGLRHH